MSAPPRLRNVAVVLAGGTGTRVGLHIPKQLVKVAGKTILEHTLDVFEDAEEIDEIVVLMAPGFLAEAEAIVGPAHPKVTTVVEGGETRNDSTRIALSVLGEEECNVLFHDAVRPLVDHRIISDCVEALQTYEAVDVAIPSADTIVVVDARGCIEQHPEPGDAAPRADPAGVPALGDPPGVRDRVRRTRTSPRPTTAAWCCGTCPTCRSSSWRAPTRT